MKPLAIASIALLMLAGCGPVEKTAVTDTRLVWGDGTDEIRCMTDKQTGNLIYLYIGPNRGGIAVVPLKPVKPEATP